MTQLDAFAADPISPRCLVLWVKREIERREDAYPKCLDGTPSQQQADNDLLALRALLEHITR